MFFRACQGKIDVLYPETETETETYEMPSGINRHPWMPLLRVHLAFLALAREIMPLCLRSTGQSEAHTVSV